MGHMAVNNGDLDMCRLFVENVQDLNPPEKFGCTPLHLAAEKGHLDIFRLLIENVKEKNPARKLAGEIVGDGSTPLHEAARKGNLEICRLISENVQDKEPINRYGFTPLKLAELNHHDDVCQ